MPAARGRSAGGLRSPLGQRQAERASRKREQDAFGEKLAENSPLACAERGANGEFASAAGGARKQKIGDICASDQEHKRNRREKHQQDWLNVAEHVLPERNQARSDSLVVVGKSRRQIARDFAHVRASLFDADAGLESGDAVHAKPCTSLGQHRIIPLSDRHIDFGQLEALEKQIEVRGNDADDGVIPAVQGKALAEDVGRRSKLALPEARTDQRYRRSTDLVFTWRKVAPEDRVHTYGREKIRGDEARTHLLSLANASKAEVDAASNGHRGKTAIVSLPVAKIGIGDGAKFEVGFAFVHRDELLRMRVGQRVEEHTVDNREDGSVGADAEGQREDRDEREAGIFAQHARAIAQVLQ